MNKNPFNRFCILALLAFATTPLMGQEDAAEKKAAEPFQKITLAAPDGIPVTGDLYMKHAKDHPFIVLCHQAGWSRGEYREIAPKLNAMGFNCVAIDQRSGGGVNDVSNETMAAAKKGKKPTNFVDAEQDMVAALEWAKANHATGKVLLWGSSYSAALSLRIAGEHNDLVDGVLAFAPGEYFARFGKPADYVQQSAKKIAAPSFITSRKDHAPNWKSIFQAIPGDKKVSFLPKTKGNHGSRALWSKFDDNGAYWTATTNFLTPFKKAVAAKK